MRTKLLKKLRREVYLNYNLRETSFSCPCLTIMFHGIGYYYTYPPLNLDRHGEFVNHEKLATVAIRGYIARKKGRPIKREVEHFNTGDLVYNFKKDTFHNVTKTIIKNGVNYVDVDGSSGKCRFKEKDLVYVESWQERYAKELEKEKNKYISAIYYIPTIDLDDGKRCAVDIKMPITEPLKIEMKLSEIK